MTTSHPFDALTPDLLLDAVESLGLLPDGRLLALNSFENRVYQVGIEDATPVIAKFYRPGRWSDAAIGEEHAFSHELVEAEVPVVAPLAIGGETLHRYRDYRFALFPRQGGRAPEFADPDNLEWMGRFLGRLHAVGGTEAFAHRPRLDIQTFGVEPSRYVLESGWIPGALENAYRTLVDDVLERIEKAWERAGDVAFIRVHGDCHPGNVLWTDDGPHFVDLDDTRMAPAVQDLWMLLSGERAERNLQVSTLVEAYETFRDFDRRELHLVEALRTLRMMHFAGWLARRWDDPAFPRAFPWFAEERYWESHILELREQAAALDEPPLVV